MRLVDHLHKCVPVYHLYKSVPVYHLHKCVPVYRLHKCVPVYHLYKCVPVYHLYKCSLVSIRKPNVWFAYLWFVAINAFSGGIEADLSKVYQYKKFHTYKKITKTEDKSDENCNLMFSFILAFSDLYEKYMTKAMSTFTFHSSTSCSLLWHLYDTCELLASCMFTLKNQKRPNHTCECRLLINIVEKIMNMNFRTLQRN